MKNKKVIIIAFILLIVTICAGIVLNITKTENDEEISNDTTDTKIVNNEKLKFDKDDSVIKDIKLGMSPEEVKEKMGEPEKIDHQEISEYVFFESMIYYYKDLIMLFNEDADDGGLTLVEVQIAGSSIKLANNLSVGSLYDDVINSYYNDKLERKYGDELSKEEWAMFLYGDYLYTYSQEYKLPERYEQTAYVNLESNSISYVCYETTNEDGLEYTQLVFYLNDKNEVSNINWGRYKQI